MRKYIYLSTHKPTDPVALSRVPLTLLRDHPLEPLLPFIDSLELHDAEVCTGVSTGRGALEKIFLLNFLMLRNEP
jgi:hypothetical protein